MSFVREKMWLLASYAVVPGAQGLGLGKALLAPALEHGRGCLRGDAQRVRATPRRCGATTKRASGCTRRCSCGARPTGRTIPVVDKVREGTANDIDLMDSVDRRTRGAAHGADHEILIEQFRLVVSDTSIGQGYAYLDDGVALLAATDRRTAARLMWEAIASSDDVLIGHITPENDWAVDVGLAARLELDQEGLPGAAAHAAAEAVPPARRPDVPVSPPIPTMSP